MNKVIKATHSLFKRPKLKSLLWLVILCLTTGGVTGCASGSKIHLFAKYLTDQEAQKVTEMLQAQEYQVVVNKLSFPDVVTSDTVIYSPMHSNPDDIRTLLSLVTEQLSTKADLIYIRSQKHSFTKNNVGLYLFGQAGGKPKRDESIAFASPYSATQCESLIFAELILAADNTFELITVANQDANEVSVNGQWQRKGQYLELYIEQVLTAGFYIEYLSETVSDGLRKSISLTPSEGQPTIDQCRFNYSVILK